ncbi:hypothetical protein [Robertkochia solimangrovi]|uniref:hypothetical protein n=1 Tax=Robertkochia solimangrovi TaxID=2213046 RepID=UPI00117F2F3F|nr:hypothetical protein [Robertkochia solimangrovi]TRZ46023.1 hypothetical protein DMZ48_01775 [Robertkochia solimangrovi]
MNSNTKSLFRPHNIIYFTTLLSFGFWLFPDFGIFRKGFSEGFSIFSKGFFIAVLWYMSALLFALIGFTLGIQIKIKNKAIDRFVNFENKTPYHIITLLTFFGLIFTCLKIYESLGRDLVNIFTLIITGYANQLKYALYENYKPGILSLRYVAILSCTVALVRRIILKKKSRLDFFNFLSLLVIAIISSRLSIIITFISFAVIYVNYNGFKIGFKRGILIAILGFHLLALLNYTRNSNFYKDMGLGFYGAGISEIITYLGAPFQGAVAVGNNTDLIRKQPANRMLYAHIEESLTTNSSFLELFILYDWYCFLYMAISLLILSFLAGVFSKNESNYLFLLYTVLLYGFAEFWRLFWFGNGIVFTLIIAVLLTIILTILLRSLPIWKK